MMKGRLPRFVSGRRGLPWIIVLALIAGAAEVAGQNAPPPLSLNGKIVSTGDSSLTVESHGGPVTVKLTDKTMIRAEVPVKFSDINSGMYVGATAEKQPDGTFRASRLHIFSEDQRGVGEGHRPLGSAPKSGLTMTNANVETVEDLAVQQVKGRMLTLKYKGGEIKVVVPEDAPVVQRIVGDRSLLVPGATVSTNGPRAEDGAILATQITVRANR